MSGFDHQFISTDLYLSNRTDFPINILQLTLHYQNRTIKY
jgi:hypothetical protein